MRTVTFHCPYRCGYSVSVNKRTAGDPATVQDEPDPPLPLHLAPEVCVAQSVRENTAVLVRVEALLKARPL